MPNVDLSFLSFKNFFQSLQTASESLARLHTTRLDLIPKEYPALLDYSAFAIFARYQDFLSHIIYPIPSNSDKEIPSDTNGAFHSPRWSRRRSRRCSWRPRWFR